MTDDGESFWLIEGQTEGGGNELFAIGADGEVAELRERVDEVVEVDSKGEGESGTKRIDWLVDCAAKDEMGDGGREEFNGKVIEDFDELHFDDCWCWQS